MKTNILAQNGRKENIALGIVAAVVVVVGIIVWVALKPDQIGKEVSILLSANERKERILERVNQAGDAPLSAEEKEEVFLEIAGEKVFQYNFTSEEKFKILEALNR